MSPLYENLNCAQCNCTESLLWKSIGDKQQLCNDCFEQTKNNTKQESDGNRKTFGKNDERRSKLRKSTRSTRYNGKNGTGSSGAPGTTSSNATKTNSTKSSGRGRRSLFRRPPMKAPTIPATTQHVKSLFFKVNQAGKFFLNFIYGMKISYRMNWNWFKFVDLFSTGILHSNRWHCFAV